jgi:beta-mannosidase
MGSLYWQLNDVWPGASWSGMDHDGNWKGLHFQARRFFADLAVAALRDDGMTRVSLLNDTAQPHPVRWRLRVMDLQGQVLGTQEQAVVLAPGSATEVGRFSDARLLGGADPARTIAVVELLQDQRLLSRQVVGFVEARDQALQPGQLQASLQGEGDALEVVLQARGLVRAAWIGFGANEAVLEDNLLDLLPGERRVLRVRSASDARTLRAALRVQTLGDVLEGSR